MLADLRVQSYWWQFFGVDTLILQSQLPCGQVVPNAQVPLAVREHVLDGLCGQAFLGHLVVFNAPSMLIILWIVFTLTFDYNIDASINIVLHKPDFYVHVARVLVLDPIARKRARQRNDS